MTAPIPSAQALRYVARSLRNTSRSPTPQSNSRNVTRQSYAPCKLAPTQHIRSFTSSIPKSRYNRTISFPPPGQDNTGPGSFSGFNNSQDDSRKKLRPGGDAVDQKFIIDEQIPSLWIRLKDSQGVLGEPQTLASTLFSIDRDTEVVRLLHREANEPAICQVATRISLKEILRVQEEQLKELQKQQRQSKSKQVELNWAISSNDLDMKLKQIKGFLEKGRRVEVLLANKKKARRATAEEAQATLEAVRTMAQDIKGCKELTPMEGHVGGQALLILGKAKD